MLTSNTYPADQVLSAAVMAHGRAGVWFLNWKIESKPPKARVDRDAGTAFAGAGLYGLCFDDRLVYVGSYLGAGKGGAFATGDVVKARWWTHVGAITARGDHVHIAPASLRALLADPGPQHPMVAGFSAAAEPTRLHKDDGTLSPLRRLRFALRHSDVFLGEGTQPQDVLPRFSYTYCRFDAPPDGLSSAAWKQHIEAAERRLIQRLAPACNTKHVPEGKSPAVVSCAEVPALLEHELAFVGG
jgi:hypothetical protein